MTRRRRDTSWPLEIPPAAPIDEWDELLSTYDLDVVPVYQLTGEDVYGLAPLIQRWMIEDDV